MPSRSWQETASIAQKNRDQSIAEVAPPVPDVPADLPDNVTELPRKLLSAEEVTITESSPETLLIELASGKLTSAEVTAAFLRRAGLAQKLANCITELLPQTALERAKYLDNYLSTHHKPIGPLHGLPISVKEHVGMRGLGLNGGFVSWWDNKATEDAPILQFLWQVGCVFYARTTEPQTLMHLETSSNLYGETVCPYNRNLTSGGSSGGEGSLIGLRGSCLGIGTDIGGSIRSPSANNGLYGLRPTSYRLPFLGCAATMAGQEHIVPVIGPLSTSLEGVKRFMQAIISQKPWLRDPSLLPFHWRDEKSYLTQRDGAKKLKVAILWHDKVVQPHPPIRRALESLASKLKAIQGVSVVDWKPRGHDFAWDIVTSLYFADGAQEEKQAIADSGEPWRPMSKFIIEEQPRVKKLTIPELWEWTQKREEYRMEYLKLWNETATADDPDSAVDVILCPVGPGAAPPLNHARYWGYTSQWNLLDYPALVFPVTKVDQEKDKIDKDFVSLGEKDQWNHDLCGFLREY
ncbi:MAG: hypothetical protein Q9160_004369 [Pyrenula sp. 1 TL-2023]